jgi:hypothetical protein
MNCISIQARFFCNHPDTQSAVYSEDYIMMHGPLNVKYGVLILLPFAETGPAAYPVGLSGYFPRG